MLVLLFLPTITLFSLPHFFVLTHATKYNYTTDMEFFPAH